MVTLCAKAHVELSNKCGHLYTDTAVHITMSCVCSSELRYGF